jgi:hypothetical protein
MEATLTRTYYYQGELLGAPDFILDQQYVRDLNSAQNSFIYTPGVAQGMAISGSGRTLNVDTGLAFDQNGVPIMLMAPLSYDTTPNNLGAGTYYVAIAYSDSIAIGTPIQTLQATHAIVEQPVIAPPSKDLPTDGKLVVLGAMTIANDGSISGVDMGGNSGRKAATSRIAGGGGGPTAAVLAEPAASPPAAQAMPALHVGDTLTTSGAPAPAPLAVGFDAAAHPDLKAAASFGFQNGATGGVVSIGANSSAGAYDLLDLAFNGVRVWSVDQDGGVHTASDARVKADIAPIDNPLDIVTALKGASFVSLSGGRRRIGVLAQDVETVLPNLVRTDASGSKSVAYTELIGVLIEAVKALSAKVERLEGQARPGGAEV